MNNDKLNLTDLSIPYMETTSFGDYTIRIEQDDMNESPREWDNLGAMICWHRSYNLGDYKHGFESADVFFHVISGLYPEEATEYLTDKQLYRCRKVADEKNIILPLYLYDHSGITMRTSSFFCPWDSNQVGYIYISLEEVRKLHNIKRVTKQTRETIVKCLESEVKAYDQYITGEIYGFVIEKTEDEEPVDSCWGFYGYDNDYMISVIKDSIKCDIHFTPQQTELF